MLLTGYKTYIIGSLAVLGFIAGYLVGDITLIQAISGIVPALQAMTIRRSISSK